LNPKILMPETITAGREIEVTDPSGKPAKFKPVSNARLDRAARELNLLKVSARGLSNVAAIGQFLDQIGILRYGSGKLLATAEMAAEAASRCADLAARENIDEETKRGYLELQLRFLRSLDDNVALQVELSGATAGKSAGPAALPSKPFLPGAQISPIQINVTGGTVTEKKVEVEQPCNK
jgi:hypothetical protein